MVTAVNTAARHDLVEVVVGRDDEDGGPLLGELLRHPALRLPSARRPPADGLARAVGIQLDRNGKLLRASKVFRSS